MRTSTVLLSLLTSFVLTACGDDGDPPPPPPPVDSGGTDSGSGTDSGARDSGNGGTDSGSEEDAGVDAGPPMPCEGGDSYTYVLSLLDVGQETPPGSGINAGFDLDGRVSDTTDDTGCNKQDYVSPPPDSIVGVDNQMGFVLQEAGMGLAADLSNDLATSIATGQLLALIRVSKVDDLTNDSCVDVELLFGLLPAGVTAPALDVGGKLEPGQTFDLDLDSLETDMMTGKVRFANSQIISGRVVAVGASELPLSFQATNGARLTLILTDPQARFDITADTLSAGMIGGGVDVDAAVTTFTSVNSMISEALIRLVLEANADLRPMGVSMTCTFISVGGVIEGVSAVEGAVRARP